MPSDSADEYLNRYIYRGGKQIDACQGQAGERRHCLVETDILSGMIKSRTRMGDSCIAAPPNCTFENGSDGRLYANTYCIKYKKGFCCKGKGCNEVRGPSHFLDSPPNP